VHPSTLGRQLIQNRGQNIVRQVVDKLSDCPEPFSELFALKMNDVDFKADSIRVDESSDQRCEGKLGPCKNAAAYRTVLLIDREGSEALRVLKRFVKKDLTPSGLIFHSQNDTPLIETNVLHDGLHPALKALNLPRQGCMRFVTVAIEGGNWSA
jgi:integrase